MRRVQLKRDFFDGNRLWEADEIAYLSNDAQPPRDAKVWDGHSYVEVPIGKDGRVDMDQLSMVAEDSFPQDQEEDDIVFQSPKPRVKRK